MKLDIENDKFVVFLNKKIDIVNKHKLEIYLKKILIKIKNRYDIKLNGYYIINIYINKFYGTIIEIKNENLDYYSYFNQVDMEINIFKDSLFLYEIDFEYIEKGLLKNVKIYKLEDKIYLKIINNINMSKLLEYSNILYGKAVERIIKQSKKVNL